MNNPGQVLKSFCPNSLTLTWVLVLLAAKTLMGTTLTVLLLKTSGTVFGSQAGYILTFAGIAWSVGLLDETLPMMAWVALGIIHWHLGLSGCTIVDT